jgi:TolB-like protein/Tfp pilus assembly protein PilF
MNPKGFFAELKRRNVYKVAVAYAVVAWLLIQIATQVFPFFEIPNWGIRLVVLIIVIGFPIALVLAWAFELTPEGIKRTEDVDFGGEHSRGGAWIYIAIVGAALSVGLFFVGRYTAPNRDVTVKLSEQSIAVLPFENQNRDPDVEYLADGIPESIINSLSQLPNLGVIARTSAFRYKDKAIDAPTAGRELNVRSAVMGRVVQRGENLSISVELVDARNNHEVWGQQYNRRLSDVFAVQEEIAKEITEKLRVKLTGTEQQQLAKRPTENLKAFQFYMQGQASAQRRLREDLLAAIRYFEKALQEDDNYALAYAGLADAYGNLGVYGYIAPIEGKRRAQEGARKALALDENLAEAHAALGLAHTYFAPSNFSLGDRELRHAIELSPSLALAHQYLAVSLVRQGRLSESLEQFVKARELDPLFSIIARAMALPYYLKRDYGRALELLQQADELGPRFSTTWEIGVYVRSQSLDGAFAEFERAEQQRKNDPLLIYSMGIAYAAQAKRPEALQLIKRLEEVSGTGMSEAHWIAKIYAALNEKELAFSWLERGLATGAIAVFYKDEPVWDPIRSDPRFADVVRGMGLPQ